MRGFGGLTDALDSLLASAGVSLPPWAVPAVFVALFIALLPHIRQNQRTSRVRVLLRERSELGGTGSEEFHRELFELANGHTATLNVLANEAQKYGFLDLAKKALTALAAAGGHPSDLHRLHRSLYGTPPVHPESEYAAIESLLAQGLTALAEKRIETASHHWPGDQRLLELRLKATKEE